jgi:hypothetical protein
MTVRLRFRINCYFFGSVQWDSATQTDAVFVALLFESFYISKLLDASFDSGDIGHCGSPRPWRNSNAPLMGFCGTSVVARHTSSVVVAQVQYFVQTPRRFCG